MDNVEEYKKYKGILNTDTIAGNNSGLVVAIVNSSLSSNVLKLM